MKMITFRGEDVGCDNDGKRSDAADRRPAKNLKLDVALGVLMRARCNFSRAARILGIHHPSNLRRTLKRLETTAQAFRTARDGYVLYAAVRGLFEQSARAQRTSRGVQELPCSAEVAANTECKSLLALLHDHEQDPRCTVRKDTRALVAHASTCHDGQCLLNLEMGDDLSRNIGLGVLKRTGWDFVRSARILEVAPSALRRLLTRPAVSSDEATNRGILRRTFVDLLEQTEYGPRSSTHFAMCIVRAKCKVLRHVLDFIDGRKALPTNGDVSVPLCFAEVNDRTRREALLGLLDRIVRDQRLAVESMETLFEPSLLGHVDDWFTGELMLELLSLTKGNVSRVGRICCREYHSLRRTLKRLGIKPESYRQ